MVVLIVHIRCKDLQVWINWNQTTFGLRQSRGLIAVRGFRKLSDPDDYVALSFWPNKQELQDYLDDPDTKKVLSSPDIVSYEMYDSLPEASLGAITI